MLLVKRNLAGSREKAKALIMSGIVYVNGQKEDKAGASFPEDCSVEIRGNTLRYVSRGGLKLEKAVAEFDVRPEGKVCMDVGASTGGFTDCMLQNGAVKVYAVDVGRGQLDWKLRNDSRVTVMERTNARYIEPAHFKEKPEITVMDVSFISVRLILPAAAAVMGDGGIFYTLIKPQFEAGRGKVGKNGVVRDAETHEEVIAGIARFAGEMGWQVTGLDYSPITGPKGNIEFLAEIRKNDGTKHGVTEEDIRRTVEEAHRIIGQSQN